MRILGIDPGSRVTGFGLVDVSQGRIRYVTSGVIRTQTPAIATRLGEIYQGVSEICSTLRPNVMAIESVFMHRNAGTALKLGHARGAAMTAVVIQAIPVFEYTPRQIKQSVVGYGNAHKEQVNVMVKTLLEAVGDLKSDAADALAVAICHHHMSRLAAKLG